jgi:hypothetical protein
MARLGYVIAFLSLSFFSSCAAFRTQTISSKFERPPNCEELLDALDAKVINAGVMDAASFPVPVSYLRTIVFFHHSRKIEDENGRNNGSVDAELDRSKAKVSNLPDDGLTLH